MRVENPTNAHFRVLAHCNETHLTELAETVLTAYPMNTVTLLSGPRQGLVMLRMQESVADSDFNAGEILVTEVRLELDGSFGFGMVLGDNPRRALAIALVDAALRKNGELALQLQRDIAALAESVQEQRRRDYAAVAASKVTFDTF